MPKGEVFSVKPQGVVPLFLIAAVISSCGTADAPETLKSQCFVFDTYSSLTICGSNAADTEKLVTEQLSEMDNLFDLCYDTEAAALPENELYSGCIAETKRLNGLYGDGINISCGALTELWGISANEPKVPADSEISEAMKHMTSTDYPENTADFPKGVKLDFGAVSKGYACDRLYGMLDWTDYAVVSFNSTTLLYGEKPDGKRFRTGITNPKTGNGYIGIAETDSAFISTSGGYERFFEADGETYCHIMDISAGRPVQTDLASVTVIVPSDTAGGGIMSDFLSTLIFTEGTQSLDKWLACEDFELIAADENGVVYSNCKGFALDSNSGFAYGK